MSALPSLFEMNPLWRKGLRSRCRLKHMLSWGVIWITLATFVFLVVYTPMVEQQGASKADAAKAALPFVLVIQAVILMFFGTSAVASGISQERDEEFLDYVRMTPMSPTAKVIGYLFGLPAREYLLFALTLPLVAIIVLISGFSLLTLGHFYLVFFTSVLVYHLTALAVGMVSPKPRLASMTSMGLVMVLYFALPNLSRIGITFFEFLTIRPVFFGLLQQELPEALRARAEVNGIDTFRPVPFLEGTILPTLYTMMVQGFLIAVMFSIVHRKWRDQSKHLFSKAGALIVFCGVTIFTAASLWAVVAQDDAYNQLFSAFGRQLSSERIPQTFFFLLMTCFMIVSTAYLFLMCFITPSKSCTLAGHRQAQKLGHARIPLTSDAASSLPIALIMIAITLATGITIMSLAIRHGDYVASAPSTASMIAVVVLSVSIALFVQGAAESMGQRVFGVSVFLFWVIPFFAMVILFAAFEAFETGLYTAQPFPPISLGYSIAWMLETTAPPLSHLDGSRFLPPQDDMPLTPHNIVYAGTIGYALAAIVMQIMRFKRRHRLCTA